MTNEYKKFQKSVLRFYDFYIEFVGDVPKHVERPMKNNSSESFAVWKKRVLGSEVSDVRVYRPVIVDGRTRIATVANEGQALKQLIQQSTAKVKAEGKELLQAVADSATSQKQEIKKKSKKAVAEVKIQAVMEIKKTKEAMYKKAIQVPIEELEHIIDQIGESLEPAVKEHLEKLVRSAKNQNFPLEALLKGMISTQVHAVQILKR